MRMNFFLFDEIDNNLYLVSVLFIPPHGAGKCTLVCFCLLSSLNGKQLMTAKNNLYYVFTYSWHPQCHCI